MNFQKCKLLPPIDLRSNLARLAIIVTAICFTCQPCTAQAILPFGSSWEYLHPTNGIDPATEDADFSTTWHTPAEYDGTAFSGPAPAMLGYGMIEGQSIATDITPPASGDRFTAYFRTTITTTQNYENLKIEILADDGGVLYLDGKAIAFLNYSGADDFFGLTPESAQEGETKIVLIDELEAGEHIFAFSLHNRTATSSDLGFDLQISESENSPALEYLSWTDANGEVTITGSSSEVAGILKIPDTINGMPVTTIGPSAFSGSPWSVVKLPGSVTTIEDAAFYNCINLTSIVIPDSVTSIGGSAFYSCRNLTIGVIPDSVTSIGSSAFEYCTSLESVILSEKLTTIGSQTFGFCDSLTSVVIPDTVTSIGSRAFQNCFSLESVNFSKDLTSIGEYAFRQCRSLTNVTLPDGLTSIEPDAFNQCSSLTNVTLPDGLTNLGRMAFFLCTSLESVTLPAGLTSIGSDVFASCSSLTSVTLAEGVTIIGPGMFISCSSLTSVALPNGLTSIGSLAFANCSSLTSVTFPAGLTSIGSSAFARCSSLTSVALPDGLTNIGSSAFESCSSLTSVALPVELTRIESSVFESCSSLTSVTFPAGLTNIGSSVFESCSSLMSVTFPAGLTSIGVSAFSGCSSLRSVTFLGESPRLYPDFLGEGPFTGVALGARAFVKREHLAFFGEENSSFAGLIIRELLPPIVIGKASLLDNSFTILFSSGPSVTGWKIMGSSTLGSFEDDLTATSVITEIAPGDYEVVIDLTGSMGPYFFRVER